MNITAVTPIVVFGGKGNWVFAQIETDAGLTGLGEASLLGKARTIAAVSSVEASSTMTNSQSTSDCL